MSTGSNLSNSLHAAEAIDGEHRRVRKFLTRVYEAQDRLDREDLDELAGGVDLSKLPPHARRLIGPLIVAIDGHRVLTKRSGHVTRFDRDLAALERTGQHMSQLGHQGHLLG